jgi:hypothetical protein
MPEPVGYWKFDEGSGTIAKDSSTNQNNGTLNSSASWATGKFGKGVLVDGEDDAATLTNSSVLDSTSFSLSMWVNIRDYHSAWRNIILGRENYNTAGFRLGIDSAYRLYFWTEESGGNIEFGTPSGLGRNEFHHVAVTYDAAAQVARLYVDGALIRDESGVYKAPVGRTLGVGAVIGGTPSFDGVVDDLRYYNTALTSDHVKTLYGTTVAERNNKSFMAAVVEAVAVFFGAIGGLFGF